MTDFERAYKRLSELANDGRYTLTDEDADVIIGELLERNTTITDLEDKIKTMQADLSGLLP